MRERYSIVRSEKNNLEFLHINAAKGRALAQLGNILGLNHRT